MRRVGYIYHTVSVRVGSFKPVAAQRQKLRKVLLDFGRIADIYGTVAVGISYLCVACQYPTVLYAESLVLQSIIEYIFRIIADIHS